jgi:hypothetical protein
MRRFHIPHWLVILLAILVVLRIPSLLEPYSYGDEMIYITLGQAIRRGLVLYRDIHDNKPPLLYYVAAISGNLFWFRAILGAWVLASVVIFWKLTGRIFTKNDRIGQAATIFFGILTTIPLLEGNIANAELFMVGFSCLGFYLLLPKKLKPLTLLLGGVCFSIAALFKIPAAFDFPVIIVLWFITQRNGKDKIAWKAFIRNIVFASLGFLIPIVLTFIWYSARGAFHEYAVAAFLQNIGYLSSWRPMDAQKSFLVRNGPLLIRGSIVLVGMVLLFLFSKKLSKGYIFATLWLLFSLFAVTLSERPYPHYLIQSVPPAAILVGLLVASKRIEQAYTVVPLGILAFVPVYYKFYYYNTASYYSRFVQFATKQISQEGYFDKFDGNVNRNYKIAQYLRQTTAYKDHVFVWGDSPPIYALSNRLPTIKYVATYHINDFSSQEEVINQLKSKPPDFIVILPGSPQFDALWQYANTNYIQVNKIDGAYIWKRSTPVILGVFR